MVLVSQLLPQSCQALLQLGTAMEPGSSKWGASFWHEPSGPSSTLSSTGCHAQTPPPHILSTRLVHPGEGGSGGAGLPEDCLEPDVAQSTREEKLSCFKLLVFCNWVTLKLKSNWNSSDQNGQWSLLNRTHTVQQPYPPSCCLPWGGRFPQCQPFMWPRTRASWQMRRWNGYSSKRNPNLTAKQRQFSDSPCCPTLRKATDDGGGPWWLWPHAGANWQTPAQELRRGQGAQKLPSSLEPTVLPRNCTCRDRSHPVQGLPGPLSDTAGNPELSPTPNTLQGGKGAKLPSSWKTAWKFLSYGYMAPSQDWLKEPYNGTQPSSCPAQSPSTWCPSAELLQNQKRGIFSPSCFALPLVSDRVLLPSRCKKVTAVEERNLRNSQGLESLGPQLRSTLKRWKWLARWAHEIILTVTWPEFTFLLL